MIFKRVAQIFLRFSGFFDIVFFPLTLFGALWFRVIKYWGIKRMPLSKFIFFKIGVFPIVDHYYEPLFNYNYLKKDLKADRKLPAIDMNTKEQLEMIDNFKYQNELSLFPRSPIEELTYYYDNGSFPSGDSEYLYSLIRFTKPQKIIEIGSGFSTRISLAAILANKAENSELNCSLTCIEPYEMPWLEQLEVHVIRKKVEDIDKNIFLSLQEGDILFVDSTHVIKPQGDVLFEVLELLPMLNSGVLIHFHDIFTPKDYPEKWIKEEFRMWNEQYLLEAFLSFNKDFKIIAALNFLKNNYIEVISEKFPVLASELDREPGSFWLKKIR